MLTVTDLCKSCGHTHVGFPDEGIIRFAAMDTGERKVAPDGTVSIDGETYLLEDLSLIGFTVAYSRQSGTPEDIIIHCRGFKPSKARRLSIGEDVDFEARKRNMRDVLREGYRRQMMSGDGGPSFCPFSLDKTHKPLLMMDGGLVGGRGTTLYY